MSPSSQTVTYGADTISYAVQYSDRKTLDISVYPDAQVIVTAPTGADPDTIEDRVKHRARWILKQQQYFTQFAPRTPPRRYISGETHLYLGRQYRLKVLPAADTAVKLIGGYIRIHTPHPENADHTCQMLEHWYLNRAQLKFPERLQACLPPFTRRGHAAPPLHIRRLTRRWGSLTATGTLILNRDLIRASTRAIDYVITHELCHLVYPDHGRDFVELLTRTLPDWELRKHRLEQQLC
ncbi:M48 family metallopeptidase [Nodosilinea sp. AN01ver1]|uniref:M48 family metallopeptidase n=1 Tax=Nodosilinea sp. AN01ver1 TaxID=3423362 RepID=UPI003D31E6A1